MLNKINRGLVIAMLAVGFSTPAYSQSINNSSLLGVPQSSGITISINEVTTEAAVNLVCDHFGYTPIFHMPLNDVINVSISAKAANILSSI